MNGIKAEIISEGNRPVAVILPSKANVLQLSALYKLLPERSHLVTSSGLASRWNVWGVLCTPEWAREQLHRVPMLKPKGFTVSMIETESVK